MPAQSACDSACRCCSQEAGQADPGERAAPLALRQFAKPVVTVSMAYVPVSVGGVLQHVAESAQLTQSCASIRIVASSCALWKERPWVCCYAQGYRPRLREKAQPRVALAVISLLRLTRRLGDRSFLSCAAFGRRTGGVAWSAGFFPGRHLAFPPGNGYALAYLPSRSVHRTPRLRSCLSRSASAGAD